MQNDQSVGLSLEEQATILAAICQDFTCPHSILGLDGCPFNNVNGNDCVEIEKEDWLECLKKRQMPFEG